MGGEPFLRDDWYQIAKEIKKYKMQLSIVSNGLDLSEYIEIAEIKIYNFTSDDFLGIILKNCQESAKNLFIYNFSGKKIHRISDFSPSGNNEDF